MKVKVAQSCPALCDRMDYSPWDSPGQNTGVGSPFLLQGLVLYICSFCNNPLQWNKVSKTPRTLSRVWILLSNGRWCYLFTERLLAALLPCSKALLYVTWVRAKREVFFCIHCFSQKKKEVGRCSTVLEEKELNYFSPANSNSWCVIPLSVF